MTGTNCLILARLLPFLGEYFEIRIILGEGTLQSGSLRCTYIFEYLEVLQALQSALLFSYHLCLLRLWVLVIITFHKSFACLGDFGWLRWFALAFAGALEQAAFHH